MLADHDLPVQQGCQEEHVQSCGCPYGKRVRVHEAPEVGPVKVREGENDDRRHNQEGDVEKEPTLRGHVVRVEPATQALLAVCAVTTHVKLHSTVDARSALTSGLR